MEIVRTNIFKYHRLIKTPDIECPRSKIKIMGGTLYKFCSDYTFLPAIDEEQIRLLSSMQEHIVNTRLPRGIVKVGNKPVAVIYDYFEGYQELFNLIFEPKELFYANLKRYINNVIELADYDIYNTDCIAKNVLYKGYDVELIDLDGPFVQFSDSAFGKTSKVLNETVLEIIVNRIRLDYGEKEAALIITELLSIFKASSIGNPYTLISKLDKVESKGIIK